MTTKLSRAKIPFRLILLAGGCSLALSTPVLAQVQPKQTDQASNTVEEVVVTAQKREENVQTVPI